MLQILAKWLLPNADRDSSSHALHEFGRDPDQIRESMRGGAEWLRPNATWSSFTARSHELASDSAQVRESMRGGPTCVEPSTLSP